MADNHNATAASSAGGRIVLEELDVPRCWTRGGLTVSSLAAEFADPSWAGRGKYRALLQFIMNWNNWPSSADRMAMLDGPPGKGLSLDERARVAAVVECLCERDGIPVPDWVNGVRARGSGVMLVDDDGYREWGRFGLADGFSRIVRRRTPTEARRHRVWFEPETLEKR